MASKVWSVFSVAAALGAAGVTRKLLDHSWRLSTGRRPPDDPSDPEVDAREAVAWAAVTGALVAVARMFAMRRAASVYARSTGHPPPSRD